MACPCAYWSVFKKICVTNTLTNTSIESSIFKAITYNYKFH